MIICECGVERVGNAKFCSECGKKFELPKSVSYMEQQQTMIANFIRQKEKIQNKIANKVIMNDKKAFEQEYISLLNEIKQIVQFNLNNMDLVMNQFFEKESKEIFLETVYQNYCSRDAFEFYILFYDKNKDKCDTELILLFTEDILRRKQIEERYIERLKEQNPNNDYGTHLIDPHIEAEKLHSEGVFLDLLKYKHSSVMKTIQARRSKSPNAPNGKNEELNIGKNDLLEILDFGLALTSPVSTARYILKMMKND